MEENYIEGPEKGGCVDGQCVIDSASSEEKKGSIEKGTLKGLFSLMKESDIFISIGV